MAKNSSLWNCLTIAINLIDTDAPLYPFSLSSYHHWLLRVQESLDLTLGVTPHSPRVGFVSDQLVLGVAPGTIKEAGRWVSDTSFRLYVDAVGALHAAQAVRLAGHGPAIGWILGHLHLYFTEESLNVHGGGHLGARKAACGVPQGAGTSSSSEVKGRASCTPGGRGRTGGRGRGPASSGNPGGAAAAVPQEHFGTGARDRGGRR